MYSINKHTEPTFQMIVCKIMNYQHVVFSDINILLLLQQ